MSDDLRWRAPELRRQDGARFQVRHLWCVGRNYAAHAREMGVDPTRSAPLFFAKPAQSAIQQDSVHYPERTQSLEHEVELAVLLERGGRHVPADAWEDRIWGYAVAVDLTRRDLQSQFKQAGQPWELSKGFDQSAPMGLVSARSDWRPRPELSIQLAINGQCRQQGCLGEMIWSVPELLTRLSAELTLHPGDVVLTGTPAGVGPLSAGDRVEAKIDGLASCCFQIA